MHGVAELSEGLKRSRRPMPLVKLNIIETELTSNPRSLSNPRPQDITRYKINELHMSFGLTVPQTGIQTVETEDVKQSANERVVTARPYALKYYYQGLQSIKTRVTGFDYDT